jgi:hypothetical protein
MVPELVGDDARQVVDVAVAGFDGQELAANAVRLVKPASPLVRQRLLQSLADVRLYG